MTFAGDNLQCRLFYVLDRNNGYQFLVDTGTAVRVILSVRAHKLTLSLFKLQVANDAQIETYGNKELIPNIGMRRDFTGSFTYATVRTLILEAYFLALFGLLVPTYPRLT